MGPHHNPSNNFRRPPSPTPPRFTGLVPAGHFAGYVDSNLQSQNLPDGDFVPGLIFIPRASFTSHSNYNHLDPIVALYNQPNLAPAAPPLLRRIDNPYVHPSLQPHQNRPRGPSQL